MPQAELNQLELQFLLLNDFRLVVSNEEMQRYAEQLIIFSQGDTVADSLQAPEAARNGSSHRASGSTSVPLKIMGAIDAYGGRLAPEHLVGTTSAPLRQYDASQYHFGASSSSQTPSYRGYETDGNDTETEGSTTDGGDVTDDGETSCDASSMVSADGGFSTDDEPTIRANQSVRGSICSGDDTSSLYSNDSHFSYTDEGDDVDNNGDRTPDRQSVAGLEEPDAMANPGSRTPSTGVAVGPIAMSRESRVVP